MFQLQNAWNSFVEVLSFGKWTMKKRKSPVQVIAMPEDMEARIVLTTMFPVTIQTDQVDEIIVNNGQNDVVFSEFELIGRRGVNPREIIIDAAPGTTLGSVNNLELRVDQFKANGRRGQDGIFETVIQPTGPDNHPHFALGKIGPLIVSKHMPMQIVGGIATDVADGTQVGISAPTVKFAPKQHVQVATEGPANPVHQVSLQASADLGITITGSTSVESGNDAYSTITIHNNSTTAAENVILTVMQDGGFSRIFEFGTIAGGVTNQAQVAFATPNVGASVNVTATITSTTDDRILNNNQASRQISLTHINHATLLLEGSDGTVQPDSHDVSLGYITVDTTKSAVVAEDLFFTIYGADSHNENLGLEMSDFISDVRLRNPVTGFTVDTPLVFSDSGLGVYEISNLNLEDGSRWEILVDFDEEYPDFLETGDQFHATLILGPGAVNIEGIDDPTDDFTPRITDADVKESVAIEPGGVIYGPRQRIAIAEMNVRVVSIGAADTVVANQKNVNLLTFEASTDPDGQVLFTSVSFTAAQGTFANGQNYCLWADTDGNGSADTIVESHVSPANGRLTFDNMAGGGYFPYGGTKFEVHMDVVPSPAADNHLQLAMDESSVKAEEGNDGAALTVDQINVNASTPSKFLTIIPHGSVAIEEDLPSRPRQVLAGAQSEELLRFSITAQDETADPYRFQFLVTGPGAESIDRFNVYRIGETTPFTTATIAATGADDVSPSGKTFTARMQLQQCLVEENTEGVFIVRAVMKSDEQGAIAGQTFEVSIPATTGVLVRGLTSSSTLQSGPDVAISSPVETVVTAKVTNFTNANPTTDNSNVPTGIDGVGQWTVSTATHVNSLGGFDRVVLDTFVVDLALTNVAVDPAGFYFYNKADSSQKVLATSVVATATGYHITFANISTSVVDSRISSGGSATFVLQVNVTNSKIGVQTSRMQAVVDTNTIGWLIQDAVKTTSFTGFELGDTRVPSSLFVS